jgi:hypothetical protein
MLSLLSGALVAARTDIIGLDLLGLNKHIAEQGSLCEEIRSLDARIDVVWRQCASYFVEMVNAKNASESPDYALIAQTLARAREAQSNVKQLNGVHHRLLLRSRRTLVALLNSYSSFACTYSNPASANAHAGERA